MHPLYRLLEAFIERRIRATEAGFGYAKSCSLVKVAA